MSLSWPTIDEGKWNKMLPIQVPQLPGDTRVSARFTTSTTNADTVRVKFYGHVYSSRLT